MGAEVLGTTVEFIWW